MASLNWLAFAVITTIMMAHVRCDIFRSTNRIRMLVTLEARLLDTVNEYLENNNFSTCQEKNHLQKFVDKMKPLTEDSLRNPEWVYNPINSLRLVSRFVKVWDHVIKSIKSKRSNTTALNRFKVTMKQLMNTDIWPTDKDLNGAVSGMLRLIFIYDLDLVDLANGVIHHTSTTPFMPSELMKMADTLYLSQRYMEAAMVYNATLETIKNRTGCPPPVNIVDEGLDINLSTLYERLHDSLYEYGAYSKALDVATEASTLFPKQSKHYRMVNVYKVALDTGKDREITFYDNITYPLYGADCHRFRELCYYPIYVEHLREELKYSPNDSNLWQLFYDVRNITEEHRHDPTVTYGERPPKHIEMYKALCQGEIKTEARLSTLYCEYHSIVVPFIRVKKEFVNIDPDIVIFHDILTDAECDWIQNTSFPLMSPSTVATNLSGEVRDDLRVSETSWLGDDDGILQRLTNKLELITGLSINGSEKSEPYQVLNYGFGGMYVPHMDAMLLEEQDSNHKMGNRIATFGFYISDVELGGATVFPVVKTRIAPKKGAAALWYNMKRNGDIDMRLLHAGCPVLIGSKWFANKWVRSHSQIFHRPCSLDPNI